MRLTWPIMKEKFFKERDFIFPDKKFINKFFRPYYITGATIFAGLIVFVHEFVLPTPDVQFDVRRLTSIDFDRFVTKENGGYFDPYHRHFINNYYYTLEQYDYSINHDGIVGSNKYQEYTL